MTENIFRFAASLIETHGTRDPFELCRLCGLAVVFTDLPDSVEGFCMECCGKQAVVLNGNLSDVKSSFCAAHELGHALLHKGLNSFFISENTNLPLGRYEREADLFAAALLLDEESLSDGLSIEQLHLATGLPEYIIDYYLKYFCKAIA